MIEPKEIVITDMNGVEKTFIISKMPYYPAREVISQFIPTATPRVGDYKENERLSLIMMGFVQVVKDGIPITLSTKSLVENHVDFKTGVILEKEMLELNAGFFVLGGISDSLNTFTVKAQQLITKILTGLQVQSSVPSKPRSTNSKRSTRSKTPS